MYVIGDPIVPDHCDPMNPTMFDVYMFEMYATAVFRLSEMYALPVTWRFADGVSDDPIPT